MAIGCALSVLLSGCSGLGGDTVKTIGESDEIFQFGAFYTPYNGNVGSTPYGLQPSDNTPENWQNMAYAGITTALPIYDVSESNVLTSLENAEKAGVKILVYDHGNPGIHNIIIRGANSTYEEVKTTLDQNSEAIRARYDVYTQYESFAGIHATDEPSVEYYDAIAACQDWWYENYPEYEFYVNLFPSYASNSQLYGTQDPANWTFRKYVNEFVETVNPSVISYDHYTLLRSGMLGSVRPQWLSDLEVFANASKQYKVPFRMYILTTQHWGFIAPEYYREIAWQVYSAMCYGVKGINFFTYWSYLIPDNNIDNLGTGLVGPCGELTPCWYACREVINEVKSFESLYMNFDWEGTMTVGSSGSGTFRLLKTPLESLHGIKSVEATQDALVGQFKDDEGNYAYMVNNYALPFDNVSNTVTFEFANCKKVLVCKKGRRVMEEIKNNKLTLEMGSCEGFFVIPIQ